VTSTPGGDSRLKARDLDRLRTLLNDWDPAGVYRGSSGPPDDGEYDCLRWPVVSALQRGASHGELAGLLASELKQHFGIGGRVPDVVLGRLVAWWESRAAS
jgi:hypothetical protein